VLPQLGKGSGGTELAGLELPQRFGAPGPQRHWEVCGDQPGHDGSAHVTQADKPHPYIIHG
jgi:hypothetical protein